MLLLPLPLLRVCACAALVLVTLAVPARGDAVLLRFYPPAGAVAGYKVYAALQTTGTIASAPIDAGPRAPDPTGTASYSLAGLDPALSYSVELTAYDARGVESRRSNRVTIAPRVETLGSVLWSSNFGQFAPGVHVPGFVDARGDAATTTGAFLFRVSYFADGNAAFGTAAAPGAVSSRFLGAAAPGWRSYELSGRVWIGASNAQAGIAARVTGTDGSQYFELSQTASGAWTVGARNEPALTCRGGSATTATQPPRHWYDVRLRVTRANGLTRVRASVWPSTEARPAGWQADCWTTLTASLDSGTFALLRGAAGLVYFDDLSVTSVAGTLDPIPPPP